MTDADSCRSQTEYANDSQQIPRSTSVIAKRMPPSKPGKGRAAIYVAGVAPSSSSASSTTPLPGGSGRSAVTPLAQPSWATKPVGSMSKRFDGKDDKRFAKPASSAATTVSISGRNVLNHYPNKQTQSQVGAPKEVSDAPKSEEEEGIAAMFQATDEHWQETQERMSQSVIVFFCFCPHSIFFASLLSCTLLTFVQRVSMFIHNLVPRLSTTQEAGHLDDRFPVNLRHPSMRPQNLCPPDISAIVARRKVCRLPGPPSQISSPNRLSGHWIQDCPTNEDRDYDNRPRIKRTTGIPRSFLKTVEVSGDGAPQGVMVTPEGGFVIAQPDS